jgi:sulfate permease, SulP family
LTWLCIDASAVDDVDFTAADMLRLLHTRLSELHVRIVFYGMSNDVRAEFDRSGLTTLFGSDSLFITLKSLVIAYKREKQWQ